VRALDFLGHAVPNDAANLDEIWRWAVNNWDLARVPRMRAIAVT
jgi:hypothetical protein